MSDWVNFMIEGDDKAEFAEMVATFVGHKVEGPLGAMSVVKMGGGWRIGFLPPVAKAPAPLKAPGAATAADAPAGISKTADTMGPDGHYWRLAADGSVMRAKPGQAYKPVPGNITAPQAAADASKARHAEAAATMSKGGARRGKRRAA
jgi:hypothetical protein